MYNYNIEFVLEQMVIITSVESNSQLDHDDVIDLAVDKIKTYYHIDPTVLYLEDVIVHEEW